MDGFKDDMSGHRFFILIQNPWLLLCVTETGYVASVPTTTELGIHRTLAGSRVPFVIRKATPKLYRSSRPCYVHRIMDGEGGDDSDLLEGLLSVEMIS